MPYIRRDNSNGKPNAQPIYADPATEKILSDNGFVKATGARYYNRSLVNVVVYDDGTWEPAGGEGFLLEEWQKMREFAGVQLEDFAIWLTKHHQFIEGYCENLKPEDYRKEEKFSFVKVYKDYTPPFGGEYVWFIQHFGLLGSDGVIPADKRAIPTQYWFANGKYYESINAFGPTGIERHFYLNQTPDFGQEMTDPCLIERIEVAFLKDQKNQ